MPVEHSHLSTIQYFIQEIEINIKISLTCVCVSSDASERKDFSFDIHRNNFALWRTIVKNKAISWVSRSLTVAHFKTASKQIFMRDFSEVNRSKFRDVLGFVFKIVWHLTFLFVIAILGSYPEENKPFFNSIIRWKPKKTKRLCKVNTSTRGTPNYRILLR